MKRTVLSGILTVALVSAGLAAETPKEASPEQTAVAAIAKAYEAAYAKGDAKALADFFAEDADYTSDDGSTISGRAAIEESIRSAMADRKGATLAINILSARSLSPDVISEKGSTSVKSKNGEVSTSVYTAIHVKKDGKWKISQLIESPEPVVSAAEHLSELSWLIGDWEDSDKSNDMSVRSQFIWAKGGNFITRNVTVKQANETTLEGWQIIGWDPIEERIRSWTFDSEGGYSQGTWTREGNRWMQRDIGVSSDGNRTSADNTFSKVSADRFTWESGNRTLNGDPQPSIGKIEVNRVKGN